MRTRRKKLNLNNEGSAMIEICIGVLVFAILLTIALQTIAVLVYKFQMGTVSDKVAEVIAAEGCYDDDVKKVVEQYLSTTNIKNATISLNGTKYIGNTNRIQLNNEIVVTITATYEIGFNSAANVSIDLKNISQTRSGVYWK